MPETTTVSNQKATVSFGPIRYTMENVFGAEDSAAAQAEAEAAVTNEMAVEGTDGAVPEEAGNIEVQTAGRTKVFTYTISESGSLPGVTNEQASGYFFTCRKSRREKTDAGYINNRLCYVDSYTFGKNDRKDQCSDDVGAPPHSKKIYN